MSILTSLNRIFFKRTSTFILTAMAGSFLFERAMDVGCREIFESINKGKLWKDIEQNYGQ